MVYRTSPYEDPRTVSGRVAATLPEHVGGPPVPSGWPAPDLALVRLVEPVDHACVYVSERPHPHFGQDRVYYAGWTGVRGRLEILDGYLSVKGSISAWSPEELVRLGQNDLPRGVSGGPVIDPVRGEVVGVLKSRAGQQEGGTSIGVEQLRTLHPARAASLVRRGDDRDRDKDTHQDVHQGIHQDVHQALGTGHEQAPHPDQVPHPDLYQAVFHAHDRYHRDRQQPSESPAPTWTDIQGELGARPGRTLSPHERGELLGLLADLAPPVSTRGLLEILGSLPNFRLPSLVPAPRGWRDGLGVLYEHARQDGARRLVLDYVMRVMAVERPPTPSARAAELALWNWVKHASTGLDSGYRRDLARQRADLLGRAPAGHERVRERVRDRAHERAGAADAARKPEDRAAQHPPIAPIAPMAPPGPSVLLVVLRRGWEPDRCDWSVSVGGSGGGTTRLHEAERTPLDDLVSHVAAPLAEAFRHCDEPGHPATLYAALPHLHLGIPVDAWRLRSDGIPLGAERPVLVRCSDRDQLPDDETAVPGALPAAAWEPYGGEDEERRDRWSRLHARDAQAEVLDCDDGVRRPVPDTAALSGLAPHTVPVLCRPGDLRYDSDPAALGRILRAGFGVALWRRWRRQPESVCGEFHRGAKMVVDDGTGVVLLPEVVHGLRRQVHEGVTEAYWAHETALLYDDPHAPLPGTGDLLEAP